MGHLAGFGFARAAFGAFVLAWGAGAQFLWWVEDGDDLGGLLDKNRDDLVVLDDRDRWWKDISKRLDLRLGERGFEHVADLVAGSEFDGAAFVFVHGVWKKFQGWAGG